MTTGYYQSYLSNDSTSESATYSAAAPRQSTSKKEQPTSTAGVAAFICHVAYLEARLRLDGGSKFFNGEDIATGRRVASGSGGFFAVDRAKMTDKSKSRGRQFVAIKSAKDQSGDSSRWKDLLLEARALLHEPLRFHPNIVHLLDLGWAASSETGSPFPTLILEYADYGTLHKLQATSKTPLPFSTKQKLCYDVGRGLSALHACGIAHGDLKHENVLIFPNSSSTLPDQPYTAKLADFGGSVLDTEGRSGLLLRVGTFPYEAPELGQQMTADGIKATDTYSFGMLVWRTFIDCLDLVTAMGITSSSDSTSVETSEMVRGMKQTDTLLASSIASAQAYTSNHNIPVAAFHVMVYVLGLTLPANPDDRSLIRAQARLRGMSADEVEEFVVMLDVQNDKTMKEKSMRAPSARVVTLDGFGLMLGKTGGAYDPQANLPGCRPDLLPPDRGGSLFEPAKLRNILHWPQQVAMLKDLERLAEGPAFEEDSPEVQPWVASYHLFQAYLTGFGTSVNLYDAYRWLCKTSQASIDGADVDYLAKAWLSRFGAVADIPSLQTLDQQIDGLFWSIIRGHTNCMEDSENVIALYPTEDERQKARTKMQQGLWLYRAMTGGTGMGLFASSHMTREYDLSDIGLLEADIRRELGGAYESCLRHAAVVQTTTAEGKSRFDKIYVNKRGHGLLHYAATFGNLPAFKHMYQKYKCNIDLPNESFTETPLVCACRAGKLNVALFCLDNGADANGSSSGEVAPLHWLCSFPESEMPDIARRLIQAGADVSKFSGTMRADVRKILADWEERLSLPMNPLGRAVLMKSLPAVKTLLTIASADPLRKGGNGRGLNLSAIELAAILTLPDILQALLDSLSPETVVLDELEVLRIAHDLGRKTVSDPLRLHSRIVRCGTQYFDNLSGTLRMLCDRRKAQGRDIREIKSANKICDEIRRGHIDIVETLLDLGHGVDGVHGQRLISEAVRSNNYEVFEMLVTRGASLAFDHTEETLLQIAASRPRTAPDHLTIAEFLINNGFSVEETAADKPSPLALAVKNTYLPLADLLIANGAGESINHFYLWDDGSRPMHLTVLGILIEHHTMLNLRSIEYLAEKHQQKTLTLEALVDAGAGLSAIHSLALQDPRDVNPRQQVTAQIIHHLIEMFPTPASLGDYRLHEKAGTVLTAALCSANAMVFAALLESEHESEVHTVVGIPSIRAKYNVTQNVSAHLFAMIQYLERFDAIDPQDLLSDAKTPAAQDQMEAMRSIEQMSQSLLQAVTSVPTQDREQSDSPPGSGGLEVVMNLLAERESQLENTRALESAMSRTSLNDSDVRTRPSRAGDMPISMAKIDEEDPKNWWDRRRT